MNDDRFLDLAMKSIAGKTTDSESQELESWLNTNPSARQEFARLIVEAKLAKQLLPLVDALEAEGAELPGYARNRLQSKVKQTLRQKQPQSDKNATPLAWGWRWFLGLAATATLVLLVTWSLFFSSPKPQIQLAMLNVAGMTRGGDTNQASLLTQQWNSATMTNFSNPQDLKSWEQTWEPGRRGYQVKIVYDPASAQIRVIGKSSARDFTNSFLGDSDLSMALKKVDAYVRQETTR
jgi:hypothetical protein